MSDIEFEDDAESPEPAEETIEDLLNNEAEEDDDEKENRKMTVGEEEDAFDDGFDNLLGSVLNNEDEDDDENVFSIKKIKRDVGFIEDEYVGVEKASQGIVIQEKSSKDNGEGDEDDDDGDNEDKASEISQNISKPSFMQQLPITFPQKPIQPSSSPSHLEHRFMTWNNIGIIRCYNTEEEDAIDIEFHDTSFHHQIHLRNNYEYTYGTLSDQVVAFGGLITKTHPSKIFCLHYSTWDSNKEWTIDLPTNEEVNGIAVGKGWIAVSTNFNRLRLFSLGGVQKLVYDLPGQVVSLSGNENHLAVVFNFGLGVNGNHSLFYSIFEVKSIKLIALIVDACLPLSPKSELSWFGFTDEGTPIFNDTQNCLKILSGKSWIPICNLKDLLAGPNDHFWVIGVNEASQNIRAVKCKSSKFPPTLPVPNIMLIDYKLPLCDFQSEKSYLEDKTLKAFLLQSISRKLDKKGFEVDEMKAEAEKKIKENLLKLLDDSIKGDKDFRGSDYVSLMPNSHSMQIGIKLASRRYHSLLADRLTQLARNKLDEEEVGTNGDLENLDDFETVNAPVQEIRYISKGNAEHSTDRFDDYSTDFNSFSSARSTSFKDKQVSETPPRENSFLEAQKQEIREIINPGSTSKANPFKKSTSNDDSQQFNLDGRRGMALIDAWKKPSAEKVSFEFNPKHPNSKSNQKKNSEKNKEKTADEAGNVGKEKKTTKKTENKKQKTLFDMGRKSSDTRENSVTSPIDQSNENSCNGFTEDNDNTQFNENENLESEVNDNSNSSNSNDNKRKRTEDEDEKAEGESTDTRSRIAKKLAAFSRNKSNTNEETV